MRREPSSYNRSPLNELSQKPARAVIAAVQLSSVSDLEFEASLAELRQLAKTLGFEVVGTFAQKRAKFDPDFRAKWSAQSEQMRVSSARDTLPSYPLHGRFATGRIPLPVKRQRSEDN